MYELKPVRELSTAYFEHGVLDSSVFLSLSITGGAIANMSRK
jgi:hypothetical protein